MDKTTSTSIADEIEKMQQSQVFVLGDAILDSYLSGKVNRISPEAPVPVVHEERRWMVLGGAGNVAANIAAFGAKAFLSGRIGGDVEGLYFKSQAESLGIVSALFSCSTVPTTTKLRVMAGYQQLLRVDKESTPILDENGVRHVVHAFKDFLQSGAPKALIISDYGKGVCSPKLLQEVLDLAQKAKIPVVTDPKSLDLARYRGSFLLKPNLTEGRSILNTLRPGARFESLTDEVEAICETVLEASQAEHVVLSLSERGVVVAGRSLPEPQWFKSEALQVADVSGAGDTMVAFLGMALAAGLSLRRAVQVSNIAAGVVCGKLGTATVSVSEFTASAKKQQMSGSQDSVVSRDKIFEIAATARRAGKRIVFTNGCFDLLHIGHIQVLQQARQLGDLLVVGLNSDSSVKRLKGPRRPLQSENDRAKILAAIGCVDYVSIFPEDTPLELIKGIRPDILVKGGDYKKEDIVGAEEVISWGGQVEMIPFVEGRSTTALVER